MSGTGVVLIEGPEGAGKRTLARALAAGIVAASVAEVRPLADWGLAAGGRDPGIRAMAGGVVAEVAATAVGVPGVASLVVGVAAEAGLVALRHRSTRPVFLALAWDREPGGLDHLDRAVRTRLAERDALLIATVDSANVRLLRGLGVTAGDDDAGPLLVLHLSGEWTRAQVRLFAEWRLSSHQIDRHLHDELWAASGTGNTRRPALVASVLDRWVAGGVIDDERPGMWTLVGRMFSPRAPRPPVDTILDGMVVDKGERSVLALAAWAGPLLPRAALVDAGGEVASRLVERLGGVVPAVWVVEGDSVRWQDTALREWVDARTNVDAALRKQAASLACDALAWVSSHSREERVRWASSERGWRERSGIGTAGGSVPDERGELLAYLSWLRWGPVEPGRALEVADVVMPRATKGLAFEVVEAACLLGLECGLLPPHRRCRWEARHAVAVINQGRLAEGVPRLEQAIESAKLLGVAASTRAELTVVLAQAVLGLDEIDRAEGLATAALQMFSAERDRAPAQHVASGEVILCHAELARGDRGAALVTAMRAHARLSGVPATLDLAPVAQRLGMAFIDLGRPAEGASLLRGALVGMARLGPNVSALQSCRHQLARALMRLGQEEEALGLALQVIGATPAAGAGQRTCANAHALAATAQVNAGRVREARHHAELALELARSAGLADPAWRVQMQLLLARLASVEGFNELALSTLDQFVLESSADAAQRAEASLLRGAALLYLNREVEAATELSSLATREAVELLHPGDRAQVSALLGRARYRLGETEVAYEHLSSALSGLAGQRPLGRWDLAARCWRSECLIALGRAEEALAALRELLVDAPPVWRDGENGMAAEFQLARALVDAERPAEAAEILAKLQRVRGEKSHSTHQPVGHLLLEGRIAEKLGDLLSAEERFRVVHEDHSSPAVAVHASARCLARVLFLQGHTAEATATVEGAELAAVASGANEQELLRFHLERAAILIATPGRHDEGRGLLATTLDRLRETKGPVKAIRRAERLLEAAAAPPASEQA